MELEMTKTLAGCCAPLLILGLQVFPAGLAQAASQEEQVTVDGPYTVQTQVTKRAMQGRMEEETISVSQKVAYSDLDMSRQSDVDKLRDRVRTAAKDSCRELERRFPSAVYIPDRTRFECVRDATSQAMAQVDAVASRSVAQANTGPAVARADFPRAQ